tara:strand:+ start:1292 stop:1804 length:513 start_codon:yes stop_codon:yes gene_type:complete
MATTNPLRSGPAENRAFAEWILTLTWKGADMSNQPQQDCKTRVANEWRKVRKDLTAYMGNPDIYENGDDDLSPFHEYGLAFDYVPARTFTDQKSGYWRYQFSYGGPSDELRFWGDAAGVIHIVEYWFLDWFEGAKIDVTDEPVVQWLIEFFGDAGSFDHALTEASRELPS